MAAEGVHEEGESLVGKEFAGDGRIDAEHARQTEGERCCAADEAELPAVVGLEGYRGAPHAVVQRMVGQILLSYGSFQHNATLFPVRP